MILRDKKITPLIMAAINGARRNKTSHPNLPITTEEIATAAAQCYAAGAAALHLHIRDKHGAHSLDAGQYRETLSEIRKHAPQILAQITTESAGKYTPQQQRKLLYDLRPQYASASVAEMLSDNDVQNARKLYHWAAAEGVQIQHIIYSPAEVLQLAKLLQNNVLPHNESPVLFVLGNYHGENGTPQMLQPFLAARKKAMSQSGVQMPFMTCAFGQRETDCLLTSAQAGGDCRIGFENNFLNQNGAPAQTNGERIAELVALLQSA